MKQLFAVLVSTAFLVTLAGCGAPASPNPGTTVPPVIGATTQPTTPTPDKSEGTVAPPGSDVAASQPPAESASTDGTTPIAIRMEEQTFSATLYDSDAGRALAERLPVTLEMAELHGNEKYYYLEEGLPTDSERPNQIHAGDLMLYGSDCLVLFYESFESAFRYTRLGSVDDPAGLAKAVGTGGVAVTFALE